MKRILFIGQAPARPGSKHGVPGAYIRPWLYRIGLSEEDIVQHCRFYALMAEFPGSTSSGHARPSTEQILQHRSVLIKAIQEFRPHVIVPVGSMAIGEIIPHDAGKLSDTIGNTYTTNPLDCLPAPITAVPLPHPSGRSTWVGQHADLLDHALHQLQLSIR